MKQQQSNFQEPQSSKKTVIVNAIFSLLALIVKLAGNIPLTPALIMAGLSVGILVLSGFLSIGVSIALYIVVGILSLIICLGSFRRMRKLRAPQGLLSRFDAVSYQYIRNERIAMAVLFVTPIITLASIPLVPLTAVILSGIIKWIVGGVLLIAVISIAYHVEQKMKKPATTTTNPFSGYNPEDLEADPYRDHRPYGGYSGNNPDQK